MIFPFFLFHKFIISNKPALSIKLGQCFLKEGFSSRVHWAVSVSEFVVFCICSIVVLWTEPWAFFILKSSRVTIALLRCCSVGSVFCGRNEEHPSVSDLEVSFHGYATHYLPKFGDDQAVCCFIRGSLILWGRFNAVLSSLYWFRHKHQQWWGRSLHQNMIRVCLSLENLGPKWLARTPLYLVLGLSVEFYR